MKAEIEEFSAKNPNPVLNVVKDGTVLYSNKAGELLLQEWGVELGEKLPSDIKELVQGVIFRNSPEKIEIKAGDRLFLVCFSPLPEQNCVNISGFDISGQKVLEEKLRESEEKYRIVADNTYDWEFWIDPAGHFQYISPSCERVTGYTAQEFMDKPDLLQEIIHSDDQQTFLQHRRDILQGCHGDIEFRIITKDGKIRWIHHVCQPVYDNKGRFAGNRGSNRDITDRKLAEEMVQGARDMLWLVMDNIPQGIFWKDRNSRYLGCNKIFAKAAGLESPKNIVGKTDYDMPWLPEQTKWFHEYDRKVMESNTPAYHIVESQQEADGKLAWIETNKIPLHDTKGNVIGLLGTYEDITERKKAEETIKEKNLLLYQAQEFLEAVTKGTEVIIATIDTNFCYTYFNKTYQEEIKRLSGKEINIGMSMMETFENMPEQQKIAIEQWSEVLEGKSTRKTLVFGNPDIYQKTYDVLHTPIRNAEGKIIGAGEVAYDVSEKVRAERALRESEEKFRTLFNSIDEGFCLIEVLFDDKSKPVDLLILDYNLAFVKQTGITLEMKGKTIRSVFPLFEDKWIEALGKIALTGKSARFENYNQSLDRWYTSFASRIGDEGSHIVSVVFDDITKRKKAEAELKKAHNILEERVKERTSELEDAYESLKESERGLAYAQKIANIGSWDHNFLNDKIHWSEEMYNIFGLIPQEPITRDKFLSFVHPDDRDYVSNSTKDAFNGKIYATEYRIVRSDGEERIVHAEKEVLFNEKNKPIRMGGTIQDITERKCIEKALCESEQKYRNIVETANEGISLINSEGVITFANKKMADMLGYAVEEIVNKTIWDFVDDKQKSVVTTGFDKRKQDSDPDSFEFKLARKDGSPLWVLISDKSIFDKDGKFIGSLNLHTDITKRKEAEEILASIELARKKEIHHRIKNNLQVISSLLDLQAENFIKRKSIKNSEFLEALRDSQNRVISMALIHEELYKGGDLDTLNVSEYIKDLADNLFLTYRLGNVDISLIIDVDKDIFFDMDTAVPLGIIVNELVSNSLKHAFPERNEGKIRIILHKEENKIEDNKSTSYTLSVSDNGVGIPEYLKIDDVVDTLGMQLVNSLVDQLDGKLELKRDNGTEFIIKFPVTKITNQAHLK